MTNSNSNMPQARATRPAPCEIEYKNMRFLITEQPSDKNIGNFIEELSRHNAKDVVRVCTPTYSTTELTTHGIQVLDLEYDDGKPPPSSVVDEWFTLLKKRFGEGCEKDACIAVHCVAGLGRAPVLVALALMELGMQYEDAVEMIRRKRRGAINKQQLDFLGKYRPKSRLKMKNGHTKNSCCMQ